MPAKVTGPGDPHEIDAFPSGVGWIAHPGETMRRASHALATDAGVFLLDPVDATGVDELVAQLGDVTGVAVLFDYHARHAERIARRHQVPVYLPAGLTGVDVDVPVRRFADRLPGTGFELLSVTVSPVWQEWGLFDGETLYVPESVGAADYFLAPHETSLGVSHVRRPFPPTALRGLGPDRILLGHGAGVHEDAAATLDRALADARSSTLALFRSNGATMFRTLYAALTT